MASQYVPGARPRLTVLLVDDSPAILTIFGELLSPLYNVSTANSGALALAMIEAGSMPDIILLDVMMPKMDGFAVLRALRGNPKHRDIPVILVTAVDENEHEEFGLSLGAVDFISKPFKPALLLAHVKTHLAIKTARDTILCQNEIQNADIQRLMVEKRQLEAAHLDALKMITAMNSLFATRTQDAHSTPPGIAIGDTYPVPLAPTPVH